jgi:hypothetical protein
VLVVEMLNIVIDRRDIGAKPAGEVQTGWMQIAHGSGSVHTYPERRGETVS